jgi:hypothetical protein
MTVTQRDWRPEGERPADSVLSGISPSVPPPSAPITLSVLVLARELPLGVCRNGLLEWDGAAGVQIDDSAPVYAEDTSGGPFRRPTYWMRLAWISPLSMAACSSASLVSARSAKKYGP